MVVDDQELARGAALEVDPRDEQAIEQGLERLLCDEALRERLRSEGSRRAAELSWDATARRTLAVYQEVIGA